MKKLLLSLPLIIISLSISSNAFSMRKLMKTAPRQLETRLISSSIVTHGMQSLKSHESKDSSLRSKRELLKNEYFKLKETFNKLCNTHFIEFYECIADSDPLYQAAFGIFTHAAIQCQTYSLEDIKDTMEEKLKNILPTTK